MTLLLAVLSADVCLSVRGSTIGRITTIVLIQDLAVS